MTGFQMRAQQQNEPRIGMVRRRPVDAGPKGIAGARSCRTDIRMAVVPVDAPGVKDPLVIKQLMTGPSNMIHDFVAPLFQQRLSHAAGNVIESFIPRDALPLSCTARANALERETNPLGIVDLIECRGSLGAISAPAAGVLRISLETPDTSGVLFDESQKAACSFTIEANRRNDVAVFFDFTRPLRSVVFDPIIPLFHRRIGRQNARSIEYLRVGIQRYARFIHNAKFL